MYRCLYTITKRLLDIVASVLLLILLCPVFLVIAIAIKIDSKGPVIFRQKRVGIYKTHFYILKFRTMRVDSPQNMPTHMLSNPDMYITKTGAFLRKTSLDELPQLINILKGDMSFVGPRPALWNQIDLLNERDKYYANGCKPGLTGLAQISGRDELSIIDKARIDGTYVRECGFLMDVKCILKTFKSVFRKEGIVEGKII